MLRLVPASWWGSMLLSSLLGGAACAPSSPVAKAAKVGASASGTERHQLWYAALVDEERSFVLKMRPTALARDPAYGPILQRASRLASAYASPRMGTTTLEAFERADEITVTTRDLALGDRDLVVIVNGVPASIDPKTLVEADGRSLWVERESFSRGVAEFAARSPRRGADDDEGVALFTVSGPTWIVAAGKAVPRVRRILYNVQPPSPVFFEPGPPVELSFHGEALEALRDKVGQNLRPVARHLTGISLQLSPGTRGEIHTTFVYSDEASATQAEGRAREIIQVLVERFEPRFGWLKGANLLRKGATVDVDMRLSAPFLKDLASADASEPNPDLTTSSHDEAPAGQSSSRPSFRAKPDPKLELQMDPR